MFGRPVRVGAVVLVVTSIWGCAASLTPMKPRVQSPPAPAALPPVAPDSPSTVPGVPQPPSADDSDLVSADTGTPTILPSIIGSRGRPEHRTQTGTQEGRSRSDLAVRVALATEQRSALLSGSGAWDLYDRTGEHLLAHAGGGEEWTVGACGGALCVGSARGDRLPQVTGPVIARPVGENVILSYNGRPFRGELLVLGGDA